MGSPMKCDCRWTLHVETGGGYTVREHIAGQVTNFMGIPTRAAATDLVRSRVALVESTMAEFASALGRQIEAMPNRVQ